MASQQADEMVKEMAAVLRERRQKIGASMNALAASSYLDRAALHRAEAGDRIPSLAFWVDWSDTLGVPLEDVLKEARKRVGKTAGEPPERRPLS
ncbi:MAG: helix-turn-helix transcriptional regulator [Verrucomicrobiae bacterium]|nr:helix-turn-helix transcriptional regulator [Verrucomicrobiae bacterium]MCP5532345.1 helix-turn-helix transcriptional regulator [Akkermansiaceae bacterium]MCP5547591.1 helix-turn-helix transcriptional regulator [Akkermansiaceae bacterium]